MRSARRSSRTSSTASGTTRCGRAPPPRDQLAYVISAQALSLGSSTPTIKNEYFASTVDIRRVRRIRTNANQIVGLTVCRSGRTSNFDCGIIRAADTSVTLGGQQFWAMWKVDMQSALGDSGAGFIDLASSMNAVGILSGGTKEGIIPWTDYTWYSSIFDAEFFLNLKTCGTGRAPSC